MKRKYAAMVVTAILAVACSESDTRPPAGPVDPAVLSDDEQAFRGQFEVVLDEARQMSVEQALQTYAAGEEPVTALSYDPLAAGSMDLITTSLALTEAETAQIASAGFAVSERLELETFAEAYTDVYHKDLPLLITTDSVLHAVHMSFDSLLALVETEALIPALDGVLRRTHEALPALDVGSLGQSVDDVDLFLTVARSLLSGETAPAQSEAVDALVAPFLDAVAQQRLETREIFGAARKMDFSQFEPRGHYVLTEPLQRYFRAMMWLARVDLRFREYDPYAAKLTWNDRQIRTAWVLYRAVVEGQALDGWNRINEIIGLAIGEPDGMDLTAFPTFETEAGITGAADLAGDLSAIYEVLEAGRFGVQRISSHYLSTNPLSAEATPLPLSFSFLGQRFTVDSHTFSNVVYDRVLVNGEKSLRALPSPLDAMFVLGADAALPLLKGELDTWQYQGNLHALRWLTDQYDADFWDASQYNLWLSALRALNVPTAGDEYPEPMRTDAWAHKTLHTQLASWSQLRHDTLLYVKQSYTGGIGCDYPKAYVEPYPELYAAFGRYAERAAEVLGAVDYTTPATRESILAYFATFGAVMTQLEDMARRQLNDEPFTDAQTELAQQWIDMDPGCGDPTYEGWYTRLYFDPEQTKEAGTTVADVHTNPNTDGPLAPPRVLHVGTGRVNLMVFTRDSCEGSQAYVGPVMSYYEQVEPGLNRLTDEDWADRIENGELPARPAWTSSFLVSDE